MKCEACRSILNQQAARPFFSDPCGYSEIDCAKVPFEVMCKWIISEANCFRFWSKGSAFDLNVVILDEFGRLTLVQQKKLLKLLKVTRCFLVLCCADEDELDPAIAQRCSLRPLGLPSTNDCVMHVCEIVDKEGGTANESAASVLCLKCGNNPRKILKILGDALTLGGGILDVNSATQALTFYM